MPTIARQIGEIDAVTKTRFLSKVDFSGNHCWNWTAGFFNTGYGSFRFNGQSYAAHRFCYVMFRGEIDSSLSLDHLCRNRQCVNPWHLEPVSVGENIRRGETGIRNYSKMFCGKGHEFTPENTLVRREGWRNCRTCHNNRRRKKC